MSMTDKAVAMLRGYARFLDSHAENIIGNIDKPNYVTSGGIKVSFVLDLESVPTVEVTKEHIALEAMEADDDR